MHSALLRTSFCAAGGVFTLSILSTAFAQQESPHAVPSTQAQTRVIDKHSIQINSDGVSPESKDFEDALQHLFEHIEKLQPARLVVFVHGGLVTLKEANARAGMLASEIAGEHDGTYPIFVNWEAGLLTSYFRHLAFERNGISYKGTPGAGGAVLGSPLVLAADLGRGATRLPINTALSFAKAAQNGDWLYKANPRSFPVKNKFNETLRLFSDNPRKTQEERAYFRAGLCYDPRDGRTPRVHLSLGADSQKKIRLGNFALNTVTLPVQVVTEPILDTLGMPAWHNMLRRTRSMFRPSGNFITRNIPSVVAEGPRQSKNQELGAGAIFFRQLDKFMTDHPEVRLDLIGHSMGTIVIDDAYRECPNLPARNIIYMAAACSIRDFQVSTGKYIDKNSGVNFYNLCLHPRAELEESHAWGTPVRGSLLVWIDEFFQSQESFGDRTLGTFENAVIAHKLLPQTPRVHLKAFPFEADNTSPRVGVPRKHGDFTSFKFWRPSFWETTCPVTASYDRNSAR
jgi:hypothetical protein